MLELLVVLTIISTAAGVSLFYFSAHQKMYKPDEESLHILDLMQEARQRALTQVKIMRIEIDVTDNAARLINENSNLSTDDDRILREVTLSPPSSVRFDTQPSEINHLPAESLSVPKAEFTASVYPASVTHRVATFRFFPNGTVKNAGTNGVGANATVTGATLFVWSPKASSEGQSEIARAITVVGSTGSIRLWEYDRDSDETVKWRDSRRSGAYGGSTAGN